MRTQQLVDAAEARAILDAALAEAARAGLTVSVAVADAAGYPLSLQRMDGAGLLTAEVALRKARTAALLRAPSRRLADRVAAEPALLALTDYLPMAGGMPLMVDGACAGAVGVSGGSPDQDEQVAAAGLAAISG